MYHCLNFSLILEQVLYMYTETPCMRKQSIPGLPSSRGRPGVEANSTCSVQYTLLLCSASEACIKEILVLPVQYFSKEL